MQKHINKIGWQKYEDFIEKQLASPLLNTVMQNLAIQNLESDGEESDDEDEYQDENQPFSMMLPMTKQLLDDITMLSNFDCWIGHTNFDITQRIKNKLDKIPGVELLKVCSRYRFFIGIGKMFDFKEVRNTIEEELIAKGEIE